MTLKQVRQNRPLCMVVLCFLLLLAVFKWGQTIWLEKTNGSASADKILQLRGEPVFVQGQIAGKAISHGKLIYYLDEVRITSSDKSISDIFSEYIYFKQNSKLICKIENASDLAPIGSRIIAGGTFMPFETAENEGQFDEKYYYGMTGYCGRLLDTKVQDIYDLSHADKMGELLLQWKWRKRIFLYQNMSHENASILSAMLLGDKSDMDVETKSLYQKSGIAHVLAISGFHISILGMTLYRLLRRISIPPILCSAFAIGIVLVYAFITGGGSAVTRAATMFVMTLLADLCMRSYDMLTGLAVSLLIVLIKNPNDLSGAGFLLSFTAVLGIVLFMPLFPEKRTDGFIRKMIDSYIISPLRLSLCINLFTLPVMLWFYYTFSTYSMFLNLMVLPLVSLLLPLSMLALIFRLPVLLLPVANLLRLMEFFCGLTQRMPYSILVLGRPKLWQIILYYMLLFGTIVWLYYRKSRRRSTTDENNKIAGAGHKCEIISAVDESKNVWAGHNSKKNCVESKSKRWEQISLCVRLGILILLGIGILSYPSRREDCIDMLSVGQGDCVVIRNNAGHCMIFDAGSSSESEIGKYRLIPYLKYQGIRKVDAVFVSHPHTDHMSGVVELLQQGKKEGIQIKYLVLGVSAKNNENYSEVLQATQNAGCRVLYLKQQDCMRISDMDITCIYEASGRTLLNENDESMVILVKLHGRTILLTGDSTINCDDDVIKQLETLHISQIDCLKVAHHGSSGATSVKLLEALHPKVALISCGYQNRYGHPHEETLKRLEEHGTEVYRTDECGAIKVRVKRNRAEILVYGG